MLTLAQLGWQPFFADQLPPETTLAPVRLLSAHRSGLWVAGEIGLRELPPLPDLAVGDWLLYDADQPAHSQLLARKNLIRRRSAGRERGAVQLIAANIDTAFLTASCNLDFNIARLERYLALALDAEVQPVILLTKADQADPSPYLQAAQSLGAEIPVLALNAKAADVAEKLAPWTGAGQSLAFLGSSGVGKSTLVNALCPAAEAATGAIREEDARGRHTTTHREMHLTATGAIVLDMPGMREIQLADTSAGLAAVFADIEDLATQCRFSDCRHTVEPDCAIRNALSRGALDQDRLDRWQKLRSEDAENSATRKARSTPKPQGRKLKTLPTKPKKR